MQRVLMGWIVAVLLCGVSGAQESRSFDELFNDGVKSLAEGRYDEGIGAFERCLELQPESATCAYNLGCGYSLKDEADSALSWLRKAADWGFAINETNVGLVESEDGDLANVREHPDFPALVEHMKTRFAERTRALEKEWKNPLVLLPEGHEQLPSLGALVVLHNAGGTKQAIADSAWKKLAHERGLALVVPSGKLAYGTRLEDGMAWFGNFEAFTKRYWVAEEPLEPALEKLETVKNLDRSRIYIAGEGQGAVVAVNAAIRKSQTYAGVLSLDAPLILTMTESYFPRAIEAGLEIRALCNTTAMWGVPKDDIQRLTAVFRRALTASEIPGTLETYTPSKDEPSLQLDRIRRALNELVGVRENEPVEAGAPK